ncbi:MAG TPA: IclR family transcriptional regulator [Steroidobacteraceae bacterium]|jgi:DNA-binding IclR family transcriptional regulator|nr:IclR family transcriptional regulator [Steroidobacteraceae bacterium]
MPASKPRAAPSTTRRDYSAPALEKGIDIIELLADAGSGLTVSEISQRLARPISELFRVIIVMERRGWLQKDPESSRYSVTYHVLKLGHRGTPAQSLTAAAAPVMHELSGRINQSCHLVVQSGTQGLVILREENPRRHANLSVRMGATLNLVSSCSGLILLASLGPEERDELLRALPRTAQVPRAKLLATLARVGKQGYQVRPSPITAGVTDISYPVRGFDGRVMAALTVPYLHVIDKSLPTTVEQTRRLVEESARRISRALGWMQ